jgi:hypothetical protein
VAGDAAFSEPRAGLPTRCPSPTSPTRFPRPPKGGDRETSSSKPVGVAPTRPSPTDPVRAHGEPWSPTRIGGEHVLRSDPAAPFPLPGPACALRNRHHSDRYKTPGQEAFSKSQGSPQNFSVCPQTSRFHPPFIHRPRSRSHRLDTAPSTSCSGVIPDASPERPRTITARVEIAVPSDFTGRGAGAPARERQDRFQHATRRSLRHHTP